jgi:endonuclease/exonuclease/phosphatase family metal-dependent hydrolase
MVIVATTLAACGSSGSGEKAGAKPASVTAVSQNILHGAACAADTDRCHAPARVALFTRQLADANCPQLVGVQEANQGIVDLFRESLPKICNGKYRIVSDADPSLDREVVFTTLPVLGSQRIRLAGPLRTAFWVRVAASVGTVEFVMTHLSSGSDDRPCDPQTCPKPCQARDKVGTCEARQVVDWVRKLRVPDDVVIFGGDLNAKPNEPIAAVIRDDGAIDAHLAAKNAECNPKTGAQCTSGRVDTDMSDLENGSSRETERIDYLWLLTKRTCTVGKPTGLFNATPAASDPSGLAFPSDHTGVTATVVCPTTAQQRAAAGKATVTTKAPTTTTSAKPVDPAVTAAITAAFQTVFNGDVTDIDAKLAAIEDGERLRPSFIENYNKTKEIASKIRVRIDALKLKDKSHADVTYTLLLDNAAVLDHLPGAAVLEDGHWLVTRRTYCDVGTQGATTIPEPCR